MKVSILTIILAFSFLVVIGQSTVVEYAKIGNESNESSTDVDTLSGFIYLVGNTNECGSNDGFIIKYKNDSVYKRSIIGTESIDIIEAIETTSSDTLFVGGFTNRNNDYDIFLAKLDTQLNTIKQKEIELEHWNFCYDLAIDNHAVLGVGKTHNEIDYDAFIFKVDYNLDTVWTKTIPSVNDQQLNKVIPYNDSIFIACGYTEIDGLAKDIYLVSFNAITGDTLWTKNIGGVNDDFCSSIIKTNDGGIVGFGTTSSYVSISEDYMLFKVDSSGVFMWSDLHQTQSGIDVYNDRGVDLVELANGDLVVASFTESYGSLGVKSTMLMFTNSLGWWIDGYIYDGGQDDYPTAMVRVNDTSIYIVGVANSQTNGYTDAYLMNVKSVDINNTTNVRKIGLDRFCFTNIEVGVEENINLYPNPISNHSFTIETNKQKKSNIVVFDLLGKIVFNKNGHTNSEIQLPKDLENGNYIIKMEIDKKVVFKKVLLLSN